MCVCSRSEPKSTKLTHWTINKCNLPIFAQMIQRHFTRIVILNSSSLLPSASSVDEKSFILNKWKKSFLIGKNTLASFQNFKDGIHFLWNLSTCLNYIIRLLLLAVRRKENSCCKLVCAILCFWIYGISSTHSETEYTHTKLNRSDYQMAMLDIRNNTAHCY